MADNVAITAGSGTTVSTDEVTISGTAVQVQHVKIIGAQNNSTNRLAISSAGAVSVACTTSANLNATVVQATGTNLHAAVEQATAANLNAQVVGSVANAATDSGNPVKIGGVARTANPTAVTDGQRVNAGFDKLGRQIVVLGHARDLTALQYTTLNTTAETTIVTAGAAGVLNDLTFLHIENVGVGTPQCTIKDATGGSTRGLFRIGKNNSTIASSRAVVQYGNPPLPQAVAANNWTITASVKSTLHVTAIFVKNL